MRILILSSSTGGGHDMRARSFESWCRKLSTDSEPMETFRFQALEESAGLYKFGVHLYNWIQKKCPRLHHLYFNWLEIFHISASERLLLGKSKYIAKLQSIHPDLIFSVHAHTNHAFRRVAQRTLPGVKFVSYCGEMHGGYGFSRHWVDPGADAFIGATRQICEAAQQHGMPANQIIYGGFLLDPSFFDPPTSDADRHAKRSAIGLSENTFTLLLSTGANGALNHLDFLNALRNSGLKLQVIALCGRNEAARSAIDAWAQQSPDIRVRALAHRDDMAQLMQIADLVVARPGTGTTSEAIMAQCPIIFNTLGGIMPQEWITVKYLRSEGLDAPCIKKPIDLTKHLRPLIEAPDLRKRLQSKIAALRPTPSPEQLIEQLRAVSAQAHPSG